MYGQAWSGGAGPEKGGKPGGDGLQRVSATSAPGEQEPALERGDDKCREFGGGIGRMPSTSSRDAGALYDMFVSGITFHTGQANAGADLPAVLELVASGKFDPGPVTTHMVGWEDAAEALIELPAKLVAIRT